MDPYLYQPREVSLETLALCNARCTFCPYETLTRKGTKMPSALIDRLIREMAAFPYPFFFSPFKVNEPFLDGRLQDICEAVQSQIPKAYLRLFSNGQPLTARHLEWVGKLRNVEHLWISLNEIEPQAYGDVMKISLATTMARLHELHRECDAGRFRHSVVVSRVSDGDGNFFSPRDIDFQREVFKQWPLFKVQIIKRDGWLGYVPAARSEVPATPCDRWWELSVCADGKAALCCMDGKGDYSIGDVNTSTLLDVYNQPMMVERRKHARSRIGIEPCQRCTY